MGACGRFELGPADQVPVLADALLKRILSLKIEGRRATAQQQADHQKCRTRFSHTDVSLTRRVSHTHSV
jgi:hypothetical protein